MPKHVQITDEISVNAPVTMVWDAIQNPATHAEWHPFVTRISGEHTLGAARKCDVRIGSKPGQTEERCSVYHEGREIEWRIEKDSTGFSRMVSEWTAGFRLDPQDSGTTVVRARSAFRPKNLLVRLMLRLIARKFHRTQRAILGGLKQFVEKH